MFNIHEYYKNTLRPNKKNIQLNDVIAHINNLEPKVLMYSINFKYRKNENDEKTTEENTTEENTTEVNTTEENTTEENTNETQIENE